MHERRTYMFLLALCLSGCSSVTRAAIFDAPDYIEPGKYSLGTFGEFLLNDPSGEGVELRLKRGVNDMVNIQPLIGVGTNNRGFRVGAAAPISFFPNTKSQPGVSMVLTAQYLKREAYNALNITASPLVHKVVEGIDHLPLNLFVGIPYYIELFNGRYKTAWQIAFGGLYDLDRDGTYFMSSEAAISLSRAETLVAIGVGVRFDGARGDSSQQAVYWDQAKDRVKEAIDQTEVYEPEDKDDE